MRPTYSGTCSQRLMKMKRGKAFWRGSGKSLRSGIRSDRRDGRAAGKSTIAPRPIRWSRKPRRQAARQLAYAGLDFHTLRATQSLLGECDANLAAVRARWQ